MEHIPFTLPNGIKGHLNPMEHTIPCTWFHVMIGKMYYGQLMRNPQKGWWLPDSELSGYAQQLGEIAERSYS